MKKYLYIFFAAFALAAVGCSVLEDEDISSSNLDFEVSNVVKFDNGEVGVYLKMAAQTTTQTSASVSTRADDYYTTATATESYLEDGWAFVYGPALPVAFDPTNEDGYGHSSPLLMRTEITINSNGLVFFRFNLYPWVKEFTADDELYADDSGSYSQIEGEYYYVDEYGFEILTDGDKNYYAVVENSDKQDADEDYTYNYYAPRRYNSSYEVAYNYPDGDYVGDWYNAYEFDTDSQIAKDIIASSKLYKIFHSKDEGEADYYLLNGFNGYGGTDGIFDDEDKTYYEYKEASTDVGDYFVGINPMCFIRFMVNLTDGTTTEVNGLVSTRMIYNSESDYYDAAYTTEDHQTYFEYYKHLSVGLDAYYNVNIDEASAAAESPYPMSDGHSGYLTSKYPMASPGILMSDGLNEYALYDISTDDVIYLVHVGSKFDVTTNDSDFTLIGATLLNGAKRALMRSSVVSSTGEEVASSDDEELYSLNLPTNLHYRYDSDNRVGSIQYNEVLAPDYKTTSNFPVYFFPNQGDYPVESATTSQYTYTSANGTLKEDYTNISDPVNNYNPTYIIVRGYIAKYHDENGNGTFDAGSTEYGYYKVPIKYVPKTISYDSESGGFTSTSGDSYTYNIVRSNYYKIYITSVQSAGYKTFEDAVAGPASDLIYEITINGEDDRDEFATSNGTFYIESDATEIFMKGYGTGGLEADFAFTVVDNEVEALDDLLTVTKATATTTYATPNVYISSTGDVTVLGYRVSGEDGYTALATSGVNSYFTPTSGTKYDIVYNATGSGTIKIQCGDLYKEIPLYYEELAASMYGNYSTTNAASSLLTIDGVAVFSGYESNSIEYISDADDVFYVGNTIENDRDVIFRDLPSGVSSEEAAIEYNQFLDPSGRVKSNIFTYNSYGADSNYDGHYQARECHANIYRKNGNGIAKLYIKQASDFALLEGDGSTDTEAASSISVIYNSKGYIYSVDGTVQSAPLVNTPYQYYLAGDADEESGPIGIIEIVRTTERYLASDDITQTGLTFSETKIESGGTWYYILSESQYLTDISELRNERKLSDDTFEAQGITYWDKAELGDSFNIWAAPVLQNQDDEVDYDENGDNEEWNYTKNSSTNHNKSTITMTNTAGESKTYTLEFTQYALPFWDPTLNITSTTGYDYVQTSYPADLYGTTNIRSEYTNPIGAITAYNCYYENGENGDFWWSDSKFGDTNDSNGYIQSGVNVQAYDSFEPEYVVFATFVNVTGYGNLNTTARDYFILDFSNNADESVNLAIQINLMNNYMENYTTGTIPFDVNNVLSYLTQNAYLNSYY